jgi:hypothetical protein
MGDLRVRAFALTELRQNRALDRAPGVVVGRPRGRRDAACPSRNSAQRRPPLASDAPEDATCYSAAYSPGHHRARLLVAELRGRLAAALSVRRGAPPHGATGYAPMMRHRLVLAAVVAAFASVVPCQATLTVGAGGYPNVDAAIAAASPGDVIIVLPGAYSPFTLTKGVTLRPAVPNTVVFGSSAFPAVVTAQIPPGQTGHIHGLRFGALVVDGGRLGVVDCTVTPGLISVYGGALAVLEGVTISHTLPAFGQSALHVDQSEVVAVDTTISILPTGYSFGEAAVELDGSRFRGSRLVLQVPATTGWSVLAPALLATPRARFGCRTRH